MATPPPNSPSFANPFLIGSGPPGTHAGVIRRALREGWGGVVSKTVLLDAARIVNVSPRYARWRAGDRIVGWENIELITDRPFEVWLDEFRSLKDEFPDRAVIASIMEEPARDAWAEIVERVQATGVDALELNLSCPHGLPERRMGSAIGEDESLVGEVCSWVASVARVPFWTKLSPNVTDLARIGAAALDAGASGLSAINTVRCVMGVNLDTLTPEPAVEGMSTIGGYSGEAVRPIALRAVAELAAMARSRFPHAAISGIGGVSRPEHAIEHLLLGASTVQVCTGVMIHGYELIHDLVRGLDAFMARHSFGSVDDFRGRALDRLTSHSELVRLQSLARKGSATEAKPARPLARDEDWTGAGLARESEALAQGPGRE